MVHHTAAFQSIEDLLDRAAALGAEHDYLRAHLAQHICVVASGAIEVACRSILSTYVDKAGCPRSSRYIRSQLGSFQNPKPQKIEDLIMAFDPTWKKQLDPHFDEEVKSAIGSIVSHRNNISHGKTSTVTLGQLKPWLAKAKTFCLALERVVFPPPKQPQTRNATI